MDTKPYIRKLAKAVAEDDPELHDLAKRLVQEIEDERTRLQSAIFTIRDMIRHFPQREPTPVGDVVQSNGQTQLPVDAVESKLTKDQRELVRQVISEHITY